MDEEKLLITKDHWKKQGHLSKQYKKGIGVMAMLIGLQQVSISIFRMIHLAPLLTVQ